jgi:hypothetical protein
MTGRLFQTRRTRCGHRSSCSRPACSTPARPQRSASSPALVRTRVADDIALATQMGGRSPDAAPGAKRLMNRLASVGAAAQFAAERAGTGVVVGTPNQVEAW